MRGKRSPSMNPSIGLSSIRGTSRSPCSYTSKSLLPYIEGATSRQVTDRLSGHHATCMLWNWWLRRFPSVRQLPRRQVSVLDPVHYFITDSTRTKTRPHFWLHGTAPPKTGTFSQLMIQIHPLGVDDADNMTLRHINASIRHIYTVDATATVEITSSGYRSIRHQERTASIPIF
jgi:hypothetical protein